MELQENKELKTNNRDFSHSLLSCGLITTYKSYKPFQRFVLSSNNLDQTLSEVDS